MGKINSNTIKEAKIFVSNILETQLSENCVFHTKSHTFDVLKNVELIGKFYNFKNDDLNILRLCALFHDVGYVNVYAEHELESSSMAIDFLRLKQIDESSIKIISTAILATKIPQYPIDIFSKILCDADLMHLTYDNYFEQIDLMRQEWKLTGIISLNQKDFHINSIKFFKSHKYQTEYGKMVLQAKKETILKLIKNKISE